VRAGEYYVGDLAWIADFALKEQIYAASNGQNGEFELKNGAKFGVFFGEICDYRDSCGFLYLNSSEIFGIIPANLIDENLLKERILKVVNGILYNKFTSAKLAKIVKFEQDFKVKFGENSIEFGDLRIEFNPQI